MVSTIFAVREYYSERSARPDLVKDLENEVQELKIALEKKGTALTPSQTSNNTTNLNVPSDSKTSNEKPAPAQGESIEGKEGVWSGLAENIVAPPAGSLSTVKLEDTKIDWQGKYATFSANVVFREPGKGSQQGHIVVLGRANDRVFGYPEGVLNTHSGSFLFDPSRGEYFSVARFRALKVRLGPYDSTKQLSEIQVFLFDLNNKLILTQTFKYGK